MAATILVILPLVYSRFENCHPTNSEAVCLSLLGVGVGRAYRGYPLTFLSSHADRSEKLIKWFVGAHILAACCCLYFFSGYLCHAKNSLGATLSSEPCQQLDNVILRHIGPSQFSRVGYPRHSQKVSTDERMWGSGANWGRQLWVGMGQRKFFKGYGMRV